MPIKFRCAYCNQLMGIARRKAGTVVNCPTCHGQVMVPQPAPESATPPPATNPAPAVKQNPFEHQNFDPGVFAAPAAEKQMAQPNRPPIGSALEAEFDAEPVALPPSYDGELRTGAAMLRNVLLLALGALLLAAVAFGAGFTVAKLM
jgi:hypothetical protein